MCVCERQRDFCVNGCLPGCASTWVREGVLMIECVFPCVCVCDHVGRVYVQSRRGYVYVRMCVLGAVSQHVSVFLTTCVCVFVWRGETVM